MENMFIYHADRMSGLSPVFSDLNHAGGYGVWVVLGAFCGSVIFIVYAVDFALLARLALFIASFCTGVCSASFTATVGTELIHRLSGSVLEIPEPVGAVIASAIAVRLRALFAIRPKSSHSVFDWLRHRKDK